MPTRFSPDEIERRRREAQEWLAQDAQRAADRQRPAESAPRGAVSNLLRGTGSGLVGSAARVARLPGSAFDYLTGSDTPSAYSRFLDETTEDVRTALDPQGGWGLAGEIVGQLGGDVAQAMVGSKAALATAPARVRAALQSPQYAKRAAAIAAVNAPVDVAMGLQYDDGLVLPGRAGSVAENVALGGVAAGLFGLVRPKTIPESRRLTAGSPPPAAMVDDAIPMGPASEGPAAQPLQLPPGRSPRSRLDAALSVGDESPLGPAIPMGPATVGRAARKKAASRTRAGKEKALAETTENLAETIAEQAAPKKAGRVRKSRSGEADPAVLAGVSGGGLGGLAGYAAPTDDPDARPLHAALGAALGAAGGAGAVRALGRLDNALTAMPPRNRRGAFGWWKASREHLADVPPEKRPAVSKMANENAADAGVQSVMQEMFEEKSLRAAGLEDGTGLQDNLYSRLERAVSFSPNKAMTPQQWQAHLEKSSPAFEREYVGVDEWLSSFDPNVAIPRAEVEQFLLENHLRVVERLYTANSPGAYSLFDLPGGEPGSYFMSVISIPQNDVRGLRGGRRGAVVPKYRGQHHTVPNYLVHVRGDRAKVRVLDTGGAPSEPVFATRMLEVQSDLHQESRRFGYADRQTADPKTGLTPLESGVERLRHEESRDLVPEEVADISGSLHDWQPFAKTDQWAELGLKKMLLVAAKRGDDFVLLPNGHAVNVMNGVTDPKARAGNLSFYGEGNLDRFGILPKMAEQYISKGLKVRPELVRAEPVATAGVPSFAIRMTPQLRAAVLRGQRLGFTTTPAMASVAGAGVGAAGGGLIGAAETGDMDGLVGGAVLGGLAGAGLGAAAGSRLARATKGATAGGGHGGGAAPPHSPGPARAQADAARPPSAYEEGLAAGTVGTDRPLDAHPFMAPLSALVDAQVGELRRAGKTARTVSHAETRRLADLQDAVGILKSKRIALDTPETVALMKVEREMADYLQKLNKEIDALPVGGEQRLLKEDEYAKVEARHLEALERLLDVASEKGRGLQALSIATVNSELSAHRLLRRAVGTRDVAPSVAGELSRIYNAEYPSTTARNKAVAAFIESQVKQPWYRVVLGARRMGMLTAPVTTVVNVTGNTVQAANEELIVTPLAVAMDRAWSALTGAERTMTTRGRGKGFAQGFTSAKTRQAMKDAFRTGGDVTERAIHELDEGIAVDFSRVDFRRDVPGPAGRVLDNVSKAVYGMMGATDVPFWNAAYRSARMERAHLTALREGLRKGTPEYAQRVAHFATDTEMTLDDAADAVLRAADQYYAMLHAQRETFKSPTPLATKAVRGLGPVGEYIAPFLKTPTNLITMALESMPGIGSAIGLRERNAMRVRLQALGLDEQFIAREMRRETIKNLARQASGATFVMAGFMLSRAGLLTGDLPPLLGRDAADRETAADARTRGAGPLTIRIGDRTHSLAAFAQFAPLLAMGHALAKEQEIQEREQASGEDVPGVLSSTGLSRTLASGLTSAGRTVLDLPMLQGIDDAMRFLGNPSDPKNSARHVASFIPAASGYAARLMDRGPGAGERQADSFTDVLRERIPTQRDNLPLRVGPLGETAAPVSIAETLFSPTRPRRAYTGPLYDALEEAGFNPPPGRRLPDESYADYSARRQVEGPVERQLLQRVLDREPTGWRYVGRPARRAFATTGDWENVLGNALSTQRSRITDERNRRQRLSRVLGA